VNARRSDRYDRPITTTSTPPARTSSAPASADADAEAPPNPGPGAPDADRIGSLRGASVQFDRRRVGQFVIGIVACALVVLIAVFTVSGVHSNNQIDTLHEHGVPVTVTVTGCLGLLGGSGSNAAGYSCRGTYVLDGHRYAESLPGTSFHRPGARVPSLAVPGDPALVSPDSVIDAQHSSSGVFVLPAALTGLLVVLLAVIGWRHRAGRRGPHAAAAETR